MTLVWILVATIAGGLLSVLAAALLAFAVLERWAPRLVSFAVGALLGLALLELLPRAVQSEAGAEAALATLLAGLLGFFMLEKFALWRHAHGPGGHSHGHGHVHFGASDIRSRPVGMMVVVGDSLHNFTDGLLIAAAFLSDPVLGWTAAIAVIAHEVPQEVGDFLILLSAGYTRRRALLLNALSSLAGVAGGVIGYFALTLAAQAVPYVMALSAAGFIYVAVADLIPNLHQRVALRDAVSQVSLIALGIAFVAGVGVGH